LYLARLELPRALAEYQDAYGMDNSPLSKLNLARLFQVGGRLKEAVLYASNCLKAGDDSWMLNYGIDPTRYKRDIHEILKDAYEGLFREESVTKAEGAFKKISYRFRWAVHAQLFRKYSLLSANAYSQSFEGGIHPDALSLYFDAFQAYGGRALKYLKKARLFEEALIPESSPSYDFEEGRLLSNRETLTKALREFDHAWEREMTAKALRELSGVGTKAERQDAAERLFALNRGALLQNGIRLPVKLEFAKPVIRLEAVLKKTARAAGLESPRLESPRYTLSFAQDGEGFISCELTDLGRGTVVWKQSLPSPGQKSLQETAFARALRDGIFNAF
jgi:hypothetical protein